MNNYTFVLAPDSFKGSLSAKDVCLSMEKGIYNVLPNAKCICVPMADGGEGTMQSLVDCTDGTIIEQIVTGPLGIPIKAHYGIMGDGQTAAIEMASAAGLHLVNERTKNPLLTTTYGVGELVKACLDKGIKKIILGIGGSATNDGGAGFAQALGAKLLDKERNELPFGGEALLRLDKIDISMLDKRLESISIEVACDVTNPLCGNNGASHVFGPQKGANRKMIESLDKALLHYSHVIKEQLNKDVANVEGAGAAGGLGAGLLAFTNATLRKGVDIIIDYTKLRDIILGADFVFTGEGGIDFQTKFGKTPYGVACLTKEANKKVIAIAGYVGKDIESLYDKFDAIFGITPGVITMSEAVNTVKYNIERTTENIIRLLLIDNKQ